MNATPKIESIHSCRGQSETTHPLERISGAAYAALPQNVKVFPPGAMSNPVLANEKSTKIA